MSPQLLGRQGSLEQLSVWSLLATLVVAMFCIWPGSPVPAPTTKAYLLAAGAILTLGVYILARLSRGNVIFPPVKLLIALWLPAIAYGLSAVFAPESFAHSFWGTALETDTFGFMLVVTTLGTLSALVLRRVEHYRSFLYGGVIAFGAMALLQMLIILVGQVAPSVVSPATALLGSYDDIAYLMGIGVIGILITTRFLKLEVRPYRFLLASGALALALLAVANVPIVWAMIALVSLGLFVEAVMQQGPRQESAGDLDDLVEFGDSNAPQDKASRSMVLPLVVLAVSGFFLIGGGLVGSISQGLHINLLNVRPSWQSTFQTIQQTYHTSPLFGSGPNTFGVQWLRYRDVSLNGSQFWNVDFYSGIGSIPTALVTTGLIGAVAWGVFLVLFVVLGLRMVILRAPEDPFVRYVSILSLVGSIYLFGMAVFGLPNAVTVALAFVFAGIFVSTMRYAAWSRQWGVIFARSPRLGFVVVFSLTLLLLASVVGAYNVANHYVAMQRFARANVAYSAGRVDEADTALQGALSLSPTVAAYELQSAIAIARLNQIVNATSTPPAKARQDFQTALSAGINAGLTATRLSPTDYRSWVSVGNLYAQAVPLGVSGAYDSARSAYQKAFDLNPTNPQIPYLMAQLDIAAKDLTAAEGDLQKAVALKQDYTAAIFLLSQVEVQAGKVKEALAASLAAAYFQPNDPGILFQTGILYAASGDLQNAATALQAAIGVNPQFANARYFLAAIYAKQEDFPHALEQMQAIAALSPENAQAVASPIAALQKGKNPFPQNLLSVSSTPVKE